MSHRWFQFQQVFLIFRIVLGDVDIETSKSHNGVARLLKTEGDEVRCWIPGARRVVVQGAGHAPFIDEPLEFDDALSRLLQTVAP